MKKILYVILGIMLGFSGVAYGATILFPSGGGTGWSNIKANSILLGNGSSRLATTTFAGFLNLLNLNPLNVGYLVSTTTATSTFAGDTQTRFGSFWNGLEVSKITATSSNDTSVFSGNISVAGSISALGAATSTINKLQANYLEVPVLGYSYTTLLAPSFNATSTATSTFAGGVATAGLSSSNGLTITGGNILHSGASFVVQSTGNVGIGTTGPNVKLTIAAQDLPALGTAGGSLSFMRNDNVVGLFMGWDGADFGWIQGQRTDGAFASQLALQPRGGNVGIGTTSPSSKLDIGSKGNGTREYLQIDSEAGAPAAGDCDSQNESGRMIIDHTNNLLYVCNQHAGRGWDTTTLND